MIETVVKDYLDRYSPVDCYMERPETAPPEYCLIEKTGSVTADRLTTSTIAVQSYAKSLYRAAVINDEIIEVMGALPNYSAAISGVRLNSDGNFTNAAAKQYRYQAVFTITNY